jgi:hypothetical protein
VSLIFIELNEVNFDQVRAYNRLGKLPNFAAFIDRYGLSETTSEDHYEQLEPWIQWITAHTGQSLADHKIFRLGDIIGKGIDQIWEVVERQGIKVGAISPMNAENRCENAAFFVPDPWTRTAVSGPARLRDLHAPIAQAVNDNAETKITLSIAVKLLVGLLRYAAPTNYPGYLADALGAVRGRPWRKAMLLDRLLADVFNRELKSSSPGFATLFLNAAAHIQHHYLFNSAVYEGPLRNPDWYVSSSCDPVLEVYTLYDGILGRISKMFPDARIMLATGLHQDPHGSLTLYWRLRDHVLFLRRAGVHFQTVEPRMSRDFVIFCRDEAEARQAEDRLSRITSVDGRPLFAVDNRGSSLFVELVWSEMISAEFIYLIDGKAQKNLDRDVVFVAVKNGQHNGIGYFADSGCMKGNDATFPLSDMPNRVCHALGVDWNKRAEWGATSPSAIATH